MRYQLTLEAEKLKRVGKLRLGCPYAVVTATGGPHEGKEIGRTETIKDSLNPNWVKIIYIKSDESIFFPIRVAVYDDNPRREEHVLRGEANFEITELYQSPGHMQFEELANGALIRAHVEQSMLGNSIGKAILHFRALDVKNVEPGMLGLGRSDPFYELEKKNVDHKHGIVRWNVVYRSKYIEDDLNPYWEKHEISLEDLCYCDLEWPLRFSLYDWQKNGKHRKIGQIETDIGTLQRHISQLGNADRDTALRLSKETNSEKTKGLLIVLQCKVEQMSC